jgi:dihydrofolate reductase
MQDTVFTGRTTKTERKEGACAASFNISVTQDGFIAGPDGEYDFFVMNDDLAETLNARYPETVPTDLREAVGISEENKVFDTVLMGRVTYEVGLPHGIASPYRQLRQYVFSTTLDEFPGPGVELVARDPVAKVRELKAEDGMDILLCGGGTLADVLYHEVDALILKRHPILIGSGIPLVVGGFAPRIFGLTEQFTVEGGVTISTYETHGRRLA